MILSEKPRDEKHKQLNTNINNLKIENKASMS